MKNGDYKEATGEYVEANGDYMRILDHYDDHDMDVGKMWNLMGMGI